MHEFLSGLESGADSLALLAHFLEAGTPELAQILLRSKITKPLLERARNAFHDPEELEEDGPTRR